MTPELQLAKIRHARATLSLIRSYTKTYGFHSLALMVQLVCLGFAIGGQVYQGRYLAIIGLNIAFVVFNVHRILVVDRERNIAEHELLKTVKELHAEGVAAFKDLQ